MRRKRRGRGEGAVFFSESKQCWIARAVIGVKPNGTPNYREVTAQTKGAVLTKKQKAEEGARNGIPSDTGRMTVGQFLMHWLENVSKPSTAETTYERRETCVRLHLLPRIGGQQLVQLRPVHIEALYVELLRETTAANAMKCAATLTSALRHAARTGLIREAATAGVPKPRVVEETIVPFTADELAKIRNAAQGNRLEALFLLAITTGMRQGELLALSWDDFDFDAGLVHVRRSLAEIKSGFLVKEPKTKRGRREVELPQFVVDALAEHRKRMLKEGNHAARAVFCTRSGEYISRTNFIRQSHTWLLEKAGVPYRKFHTYRHTHVSTLLASGVNVVETARRIGDTVTQVTKTYAHVIDRNSNAMAKRIEALYG